MTMPIFEFRCLECNDVFELLMLGGGDAVEMRCPKCKSETFERVMSSANYAMASGATGSSGPTAKNRQCKSGNCTTYEIPGP
ncbi:MAG: zinc ribbon domain-containing protein [Desulfobacterales bacterium]|jgi:putative FmdB family regulatory protein